MFNDQTFTPLYISQYEFYTEKKNCGLSYTVKFLNYLAVVSDLDLSLLPFPRRNAVLI
jgi:hypothetical protein